LRAVKVEQSKSHRVEDRQRGWAREEMKFKRDSQRRNSFLMFLFFALAVAVYLGGRMAAPKLVVTLDRGQGEVIVDGQSRGRTGETIKNLTVGEHEVTVFPDNPRIALQPPQIVKTRVTWGLHTTEVHFPVKTIGDLPDSLKQPIR